MSTSWPAWRAYLGLQVALEEEHPRRRRSVVRDVYIFAAGRRDQMLTDAASRVVDVLHDGERVLARAGPSSVLARGSAVAQPILEVLRRRCEKGAQMRCASASRTPGQSKRLWRCGLQQPPLVQGRRTHRPALLRPGARRRRRGLRRGAGGGPKKNGGPTRAASSASSATGRGAWTGSRMRATAPGDHHAGCGLFKRAPRVAASVMFL